MVVSLTRLRVKNWYLLPRFFNLSGGAIRQANEDPSCLGGATYIGPGLTFWTVTQWRDEASMKLYARSGAHLKTMPWLARICSEGATFNYETSDEALPTAQELRSRLAASPKFIRVAHPSRDQKENQISEKNPWHTSRFK